MNSDDAVKKILIAVLSLVTLLSVAVGVVYFYFPQVLIDVTNSQYASAASLQKKNNRH